MSFKLLCEGAAIAALMATIFVALHFACIIYDSCAAAEGLLR